MHADRMHSLVAYSSSDSDSSDGRGRSRGPDSGKAATPPGRGGGGGGGGSAHHGRVRTFPHVDGQYAVHVHVSAVPPADVVAGMVRCIAEV